MASHLSNTYARGSLPSKRFQSSYAGAKIRVEKQKTTKKKRSAKIPKKKNPLFGIRLNLHGNACFSGYARLRKFSLLVKRFH